MVQAIIFDCFGVLYGSALQRLRSLCLERSLDDLDAVARATDLGTLSQDESIAAIARLIGKSAAETAQIIAAQRQRNPDLVEYVYDLRERGYKTALLSNVGSDVIDRLFTPEEQRGMFDVVVESYQVHMLKPDPKIFELAAERLQITPGACVMIDDIEANCLGAEQAGMQAICHTTNDSTKAQLETLLGV